ncbi:MAG: tetratricopeptide repeat protein [Phycisphaerales bacterium]
MRRGRSGVRNMIGAVALVAGMCVGAAPSLAQSGSDTAYRAGTGLLNKGLHELAAAEFEKFLTQSPDHEKAPTAHYALGVCLYRMGKHAEAARELDRVVSIDRFEFAPDALLLRGQCSSAMGEEKDASKWYGRVVREHAESAAAESATLLLGESLYRTGEVSAARDALGRFLRRWSESGSRPRAELFMALCEASDGDYSEAATRLKALRGLRGAEAYEARATLLEAQCRHRAGESAEALRLYESAAGSNEAEVAPDALLGLGQLRRAAGDRAGAASALDTLMARYPMAASTAGAWIERARVYIESGQPGDAMRLLDARAGEFPESLRDDAAFWTARCESDGGDHAGAAARLSAAVREFGSSPLIAEMQFDQAREWSRLGEAEKAVAGFAAFRQAHPEHPLASEALSAIVGIEYQRGSYAEAASAGQRFLEESGNDDSAGAVEMTVAECRFMLGDYAEAEQAYRMFEERHPADALASHARARRGLALVRLDRFKEAEPLLNAAVSPKDGAGAIEGSVRRAVIGALADGCFALGRWEEAAAWLGALVSESGGDDALDVPLLKRGLALHRSGKPAEAVAAYQRLLREYPSSPLAAQTRFELGQAWYESGRLDEARGAFEHVLAAASEPARSEAPAGSDGEAPATDFVFHAARFLAVIASKQGRTADAAALYERAAAMAGDSALGGELLLEQGSASLSAGKYPEAEEALRRFLAAHAEHARLDEARGLHGIALSRLGKHDEALGDLQQALQKQGAIPRELREAVEYERAWTLAAIGRSSDAAGAYAALIKSRPAAKILAHATVEFARLQVADERFEEALELLATGPGEFAGVSPALDEHAAYLRGVCELRLGRHREAAETLAEFVKAHPQSELAPSATMMLADALMKIGRPEEAAERLRRVVDASPSSEVLGPALLRLGEAAGAAQQWVASEDAFARFLVKFADDELAFQARFGVGWARENQGRHEAAIEAYRPVAAEHKGPTAARAQFQIGECLFAMKKYDEAVRELIKTDILFAYPEWSAAALYEAGRCFAEAGKPVDAKKQFEEVVQRFGESKWAALSRERLQASAPDALPGNARTGTRR